jgi:serine/threonine protein kinase
VSNRKVAIKKVKDVFRNLTDAKRILRELKLLRHLGGHENIIWILDIMVSPNQRDFKDLYIVTDLMETDLGRIIDSSQTLSDAHIKYFMYQILRAMKYIHSAKVRW